MKVATVKREEQEKYSKRNLLLDTKVGNISEDIGIQVSEEVQRLVTKILSRESSRKKIGIVEALST